MQGCSTSTVDTSLDDEVSNLVLQSSKVMNPEWGVVAIKASEDEVEVCDYSTISLHAIDATGTTVLPKSSDADYDGVHNEFGTDCGGIMEISSSKESISACLSLLGDHESECDGAEALLGLSVVDYEIHNDLDAKALQPLMRVCIQCCLQYGNEKENPILKCSRPGCNVYCHKRCRTNARLTYFCGRCENTWKALNHDFQNLQCGYCSMDRKSFRSSNAVFLSHMNSMTCYTKRLGAYEVTVTPVSESCTDVDLKTRSCNSLRLRASDSNAIKPIPRDKEYPILMNIPCQVKASDEAVRNHSRRRPREAVIKAACQDYFNVQYLDHVKEPVSYWPEVNIPWSRYVHVGSNAHHAMTQSNSVPSIRMALIHFVGGACQSPSDEDCSIRCGTVSEVHEDYFTVRHDNCISCPATSVQELPWSKYRCLSSAMTVPRVTSLECTPNPGLGMQIPTRCKKTNCKFYGSEAYDGLCSKCYLVLVKHNKATHKGVSRGKTSSLSVASKKVTKNVAMSCDLEAASALLSSLWTKPSDVQQHVSKKRKFTDGCSYITENITFHDGVTSKQTDTLGSVSPGMHVLVKNDDFYWSHAVIEAEESDGTYTVLYEGR